ncbi:MAG TPA: hypothetical protein VJ870_01560 [Amycolatopsis sp.]|nr:hypothetical protein [Amycolatopsis sp.]
MPPDYDTELAEARRAIRARAADHIAEVVRNAGKPTPDQMAQLRRLLPPPSPERIRAVIARHFPDGIPCDTRDGEAA